MAKFKAITTITWVFDSHDSHEKCLEQAKQKLGMGNKEEKTKSIRAFESIWLHWNAKRSPVRGVAVAFTIVENGKSVKKAGWSLCNDEDKFNRFIGIRKAINYAQNINGLNYDAIPYRAFETVQCVIERANYEKSF